MTVRDIELDVEGDLAFDGTDLVLVSDAEAIQQSMYIRLQFFKGEWFLDTEAGLPYFQQILVKNPNPNVLTKLFRDECASTPGVRNLTQFALAFDSETRTLQVTFSTDFDVALLSG